MPLLHDIKDSDVDKGDITSFKMCGEACCMQKLRWLRHPSRFKKLNTASRSLLVEALPKDR